MDREPIKFYATWTIVRKGDLYFVRQAVGTDIHGWTEYGPVPITLVDVLVDELRAVVEAQMKSMVEHFRTLD